MFLRILFLTTACVILVACCQHASGQQVQLAQFEVPDVVPPSFDSEVPPVAVSIQEDDLVPEPVDPVPAEMEFVDYPQAPYAPAAELWAGFCGHEETLCHCPGTPAWASVDLLWLNRSNPDNYILATDDFDDVVLRTDDFSFDFQPGLRLTYGQEICCTPVEFTYFGLHDWNSSIYADGQGDLDVPFAPLAFGAFQDADYIEADYSSQLHSFEVNFLQADCCCCRSASWLAGLRLINVDERFRMWTEDQQDPDGGYLSIKTDNILLGLQAGGTIDRQYNCWCFGATGKAGAYLNFADGNLYVYDRDGLLPPLEESDTDNSTDVAFVAELDIGVSRHLACGVAVRAGYQVTWISGLALATEQISSDVTRVALDTDGDVLYNGGYVGLEWCR